jgi:hypothetical protein
MLISIIFIAIGLILIYLSSELVGAKMLAIFFFVVAAIDFLFDINLIPRYFWKMVKKIKEGGN